MRLFLDTEFNGFGGDLISLALVAEDGREWYGVLPLPPGIMPWVKANVLPHLILDGDEASLFTSLGEFQSSLACFLIQFDGAEVIADWPSDFEHLCHMMTYAGMQAGWRIPIECTMRLVRVPNVNPEVPHNALSDARALAKAYMAYNEKSPA